MNSINKNQPEQNHADLHGTDAVAKIKELIAKTENGFFCTEGPHGARPMNVRSVDDAGQLWFLAASDSHLVEELRAAPSVKLYFQGSPHSDFLHLKGHATISQDKAKIKQL
jgi:general stress protein 26